MIANTEQSKNPTVKKALAFATAAHEGQFRKISGLPYIEHPKAVADIAVEIWGSYIGKESDFISIVALLHDTVEDSDGKITIDDINNLFGESVSKAVDNLTRKPDEEYLDYIIRAASYDERVAIIKIADLTHNLSDLPAGAKRDKYLMAKYIIESFWPSWELD
jgi:guanosine-3',5'-bis(diphosphate) 3'-pyrophosphohydrolase